MLNFILDYDYLKYKYANFMIFSPIQLNTNNLIYSQYL